MKRLLSAILPLVMGCEHAPHKLAYPEAKREVVTDTMHGYHLADHYRWMENMDGAEVKRFAMQQDSLLSSFISQSGIYEEVYENISGLMSHDRYNFRNSFVLPEYRNGTFFYNKIAAGDSKNGLYSRDSIRGEERQILAPDFEDEQLELSGYSLSPAGDHLAYGVAKPSSIWTELRISGTRDLGKVNETIPDLYGGVNLQWTASGDGFYYKKFDREAYEKTLKLPPPTLRYHQIGSDYTTDKVIYRQSDGSNSLNFKLSSDKSYLVIKDEDILVKSSITHDSSVDVLIPKIPNTSFSFIGNLNDLFYFKTDHHAPQGKVIAIDLSNPAPENWKTIIPESENALRSVVYTSGKFVAISMTDLIEMMSVYDAEGTKLYTVDKPFLGFSYRMQPLGGNQGIFYSLINLFNPQSILHLDLETGESTFFLRPELLHDPNEFEMQQIFYESHDGVVIPAFLSYKKGMKKGGDNPTMVYGYGALGWPTVSYFQSDVVEWLSRGGIYLNAGIRGGGEYGNEWRDAGRGRNKLVGIKDYIAASEWLIQENYTSPSKLVCTGGSLGAILPSAAITMRPELYEAAIIRVPIVDLMRYTNFGYARRWISEFGDPAIEQDFQSMIAYAPYIGIEDGSDYPATFIQCGENDETAPPFHAYKFAAALQHAQNANEPILLKTSWGAGHYNGGVTAADQSETRSQIVTFLLNQFPEMRNER